MSSTTEVHQHADTRLLTAVEAAEMLRVSAPTVQAHVREGRLPSVHKAVGSKRVLIPVGAIHAFIRKAAAAEVRS